MMRVPRPLQTFTELLPLQVVVAVLLAVAWAVALSVWGWTLLAVL